MEEIKNTQRKIIFINMTIVTLILVFTFGALQIIFCRNLEMNMNNHLGNMLHMFREKKEVEDKQEKRDRPELPYFVLHQKADGTIQVIDGVFYENLSQKEIEEIADSIMKQTNDFGVLSKECIRYIRMEKDGEWDFACMDNHFEQKMIQNNLEGLCFIGGVVWIFFLVFTFLLSIWLVKPIEEAFGMQRRFVADASHELKTPVTVISTNISLLTADMEGLAEERKRWLSNISDEVRDMKYLVEELLDTARLENRKYHYEMGPIDISSTIMECLLEFDVIFFQQDRFLSYDVEEKIVLKGNEDRIKQIIKIFLDNAIKYSPEKSETHVKLERKKKNCELTVVSSGTPIPKKKRKEIFRRFYRLDESRGEQKGYGIGLAIARQIVTEHKGKIYVESDEINKNIFHVILPVK